MEEAGHQFILCFIDEDPVAFASWSETEPHIYKLHKIYILPHLQGIGVGKLMMGYIVNELRKKGATFLRLNVNRYNTSAITFYNKSGFEHFGDEDIDIGNGYFMNDHVLSLRIL